MELGNLIISILAKTKVYNIEDEPSKDKDLRVIEDIDMAVKVHSENLKY